jgi:arylsulfatase
MESTTITAASASQETDVKSVKQLRQLIGLLFIGAMCLLSIYANIKTVNVSNFQLPQVGLVKVYGETDARTADDEQDEQNPANIASASKWINKRPEAEAEPEPVVERKDSESSTTPETKAPTSAPTELPVSSPTTTVETKSASGETKTDSNSVTDGTSTINSKYDSSKPLNVVLFFADDWSFNMIGKTNPYLQTPNLDRLAEEGMHFSHNCVVASVCMQSRATLYTGQYSMRHQTYMSWQNVKMYDGDNWNYTLYPTMMSQNYHVGFFGKYHHLEEWPRSVPTFTQFKSLPYEHLINRGGVVKHVTQLNEEDGIEFLDNRPDEKPFFLTVSFFATHAMDGDPAQYIPMNSSMHLYQDTPVPYPQTYTEEHWKMMPYFFTDHNEGRHRFGFRYKDRDMYQHHMKNTCRMVTEVDTAIGNMIDKLKDQGVYDNTMIIFTTDNGNMHGQHGLAEKWYSYEESLRTPLIIKDPRMPTELVGTTNDEFTLNIDLAPTIISAVGGTVPDVMQGRDMAQLYLDAANTIPIWRKEFLYEFHDTNPNIPNSLALVNKEYKLIYWDDFNYTQLFHLTKDPYEENDLLNVTDPAFVNAMWERLLALNSTLETDTTY